MPNTALRKFVWRLSWSRGSISKAYVDEEGISLSEGFEGAQGIESLIFFRLSETNCRSAKLAQFMLFPSRGRENELNKSSNRAVKSQGERCGYL